MEGGENMKKIIAIVLCAVFLIVGVETVSFASNTSDEITPRLNNVNSVVSNFVIVNGNAVVSISYTGAETVTTGATVTIQLQKRNLLVLWKDVKEWVYISYDPTASFEFSYPVSSGTYRAKIRYEIKGSGGTTDVIEHERQASY